MTGTSMGRGAGGWWWWLAWRMGQRENERGAWRKLSSAATCEPRGIGGTCRLRTPVAGRSLACRCPSLSLWDRPGGQALGAPSR